jgi:hypothetical protein
MYSTAASAAADRAGGDISDDEVPEGWRRRHRWSEHEEIKKRAVWIVSMVCWIPKEIVFDRCFTGVRQVFGRCSTAVRQLFGMKKNPRV